MRAIVALFLLALLGCDQPKDTPSADPASAASRPMTDAAPSETPPKTSAEPPSPPVIPIPQEKWNLDYAEKTWGLKLKRFEYGPHKGQMGGGDHFSFLLEFTKDLKGEEMKAFTNDFTFPSSHVLVGLEFAILDHDNVVIHKVWDTPTYFGERSGVKGDAFWLCIHDGLSSPYSVVKVPTIKRIELRPKKR